MPDEANEKPRDRVIADTGWGIKPDDQPSNVDEARAAPAGANNGRVLHYDAAVPNPIRQILIAQRRACNTANRVRLEPTRLTILDINGDPFIVEGLRYGDPNLIPLLQNLGAAFDPEVIRRLTPGDPTTFEYPLSRAWAWGAERSGG
jgi:hypothetical protein